MLKQFNRMSLRATITGFVAVAVGATLIVSAIGWLQMQRSEDMAAQMQEVTRTARAAGMLDMNHDALRGDALRLAYATQEGRADALKEAQADAQAHGKAMRQWFDKVRGGANSDALKQALTASDTEITAYIAAVAAVGGDAAALKSTLAEVERHFGILEERLESVGQLVEAESDAAAQAQAAMFATERLLLVGTLLGTAAVVGLLGVSFMRALMGRLGAEPWQLRATAERIAAGDLATPPDFRAPPPRSVADAVLAMRDALARTVGEIRRGADQVATASQQIAGGNVDLARRTEEQSARLQQSTASMQTLGENVRQGAGVAREADAVAREASQVAQEGGAVVQQVVQTMGGINDSSRRIGDIIGTIDSIAFQTNILALNAAVEAARAGEQGRGFAVVASEVRALAQRSASAAREIKQLVGESVARVERGSADVERAGATMQQVLAAIGRLGSLMGEVTTSTSAQTATVDEIGAAVSAIDGVTQQNAALVEQTAAAAESLQEQARLLVGAVDAFRVGAPQPA
jgi:methyl-accepting chemotaxis protein